LFGNIFALPIIFLNPDIIQTDMTLVDHETGKNIINPYITLYSPEKSWVALNTETYADAQQELISIHDEKKFYDLYSQKRPLYRVVATVAKQNSALEQGSNWPRTVRVEGASDAVALIPMGYILEDVVKELFPKSFEYFEHAKNKQ
jgi:hypothetical protein